MSQSVALPGMSTDELHIKCRIFGVTAGNYKQEVTKYPKVRIIENRVKAWAWCQKTFGNNWIWSSPTQVDYCDIFFLHSEDALLFKLTWNTI